MSNKNRARIPFVARPFEGLAAEEDFVAFMQIVPAGRITVRLIQEYGGTEVDLVTLLPDLAQAFRRADGRILVALQTVTKSGDSSRDVAAALLSALELEPGSGLAMTGLPEPGPRLQDILDSTFTPVVEVKETFDFWLTDAEAASDEAAHALAEAKEDIAPTLPVPGVEHAYWCQLNGKEFVRWVRGENEDAFFNAFARLHGAGSSDLNGQRFLGAFRACGLAIPVWELEPGTTAQDLTAPMQEMATRLDEALAVTGPLDAAARRAKAGIISRQVNL